MSQDTVNIFEGLKNHISTFCISADGLNNLFHAVFGENTHTLLLLKHLFILKVLHEKPFKKLVCALRQV
jgi:hypothetical protein